MEEMKNLCKNHLLYDILPFWEERTEDRARGGYLTAFDREGRLIDSKKYMWLHGRQLWMFSALYNEIEKREKWLHIAEIGCLFIIRHGYAGNGRWHYCLSDEGEVIQGPVSIFSDMFILAGLCEYYTASKDETILPYIHITYDTLESVIYKGEFLNVFPYKDELAYKRHGVYSIALNTAVVASQVLGKMKTEEFIKHCVNQVLYSFSKDEHKTVFEVVTKEDKTIDNAEGNLINPGHIVQSSWFCIEAGRGILKSTKVVERAMELAEWAWNLGYDREYGGLFSFVKAGGGKPKYTEWHKHKKVQWDDKIWWSHAEALYTYALVALHTNAASDMERYTMLYRYCQEKFFDPVYKEWYTCLTRQGISSIASKGNDQGIQKCAFHLPRAFMKLTLLFEDYMKDKGKNYEI